MANVAIIAEPTISLGGQEYKVANPIQPVGHSDIFESARQQDAERRERDAMEHFNRTGELPQSRQEHSPLVPINGQEPPDVATDGDSYDESRRLRNRQPSVDDAMSAIFGQGYTASREHTQHQKALREQAIKAEESRKQKKKDEIKELREKSKSKFNNAIAGLEVDDDEE